MRTGKCYDWQNPVACSGSEVNQERWRTAVRAVVALHSMRPPKPAPVAETDEEEEEEEQPPGPGVPAAAHAPSPRPATGLCMKRSCMHLAD
jgi:hypothetical protein